MGEPLIRSIADTARWVAFHRAIESERSDALFSDPYARKLAGERGELIAKHMDVGQHVALRTVLFDSLPHKQLARAGRHGDKSRRWPGITPPKHPD